MKAYLSYSLSGPEKYIITILGGWLDAQKFFPASTYYEKDTTDVSESRWEIRKSTLFIGMISANGDARQRVLAEWNMALEYFIPAVLLVEDNLELPAAVAEHPNVVRFNREKPEKAIALAKKRILAARKLPEFVPDRPDHSIGWVLGGHQVLRLIGLLATAGR